MKPMRNRPFSREGFERNLFLLVEAIKNGNIHFASHIRTDGLLRVRILPNGRIDFLSVDEGTRLKANTMAEFGDQSSQSDVGAVPEESSALPTPPVGSPNAEAGGVDVDPAEPGFEEVQFSERLIELCLAVSEQAAVEALLTRFEGELRSGDFNKVSRLLRAIEVDRLPSSVLVAALSITLPAKAALPVRLAFLSEVERWLRTAIGPLRTETLLANRR